jgi:CheY-like chemotaxis protein
MAHEGRSGVAQALAFLPDVALVDLGLPDIDGYAVAKQMRQHPRLKHVRLVAQTGWGQAQDRARTKDAGFDHHLVKPVDPAQLAALVARHDTSRPH